MLAKVQTNSDAVHVIDRDAQPELSGQTQTTLCGRQLTAWVVKFPTVTCQECASEARRIKETR